LNTLPPPCPNKQLESVTNPDRLPCVAPTDSTHHFQEILR